MSVDTSQSQQQPSATPERAMLDTVRRRLIAIHYSLVEATSDDRDAKVWAQDELMEVIRELAPYRRPRSKTTET